MNGTMVGFIGRMGVGVVLTIGSLAIPGVARANHECFHYRGQCYHFSGESQMIGALENLEQAFNNPAQARAFVRRADWEATFALDAVAGGKTRYFLQRAVDYMDRFLWQRDVCDLEQAAQLLQQALLAEQHARGCGGPAIPAPVAPPVPVPSYYPATQPTIVVPPPAPQPPRHGIRISGKHGSLFFSF